MRCGDHDQGPLECHEEPREVLVDRPVEECGMEAFNTCRPVTRLTPSLVPKQTCRDVPRETCSDSKVSTLHITCYPKFITQYIFDKGQNAMSEKLPTAKLTLFLISNPPKIVLRKMLNLE